MLRGNCFHVISAYGNQCHLCVCVYVRALKGKRLELSTINLLKHRHFRDTVCIITKKTIFEVHVFRRSAAILVKGGGISNHP